MRMTNKMAVALGALTVAGAVGLSTFALADYERDRKGGRHWEHHHKAGQHRHHGWHHRARKHQARMLERFDGDKDGKLTQEELDQSRRDLLAKHDADKDGNISLEEFKALWLEVFQRRVVRGFQRIDTDGDASITVEEFLKPYSKTVKRMDRNEDGVLDDNDRKRRHDRDRDNDGGSDEKKG